MYWVAVQNDISVYSTFIIETVRSTTEGNPSIKMNYNRLITNQKEINRKHREHLVLGITQRNLSDDYLYLWW